MWMAVTADKYELPLSHADTIRGLGEKMSVNYQTLLAIYQRGNDSRNLFNGEKYRV